MRTKPQYAGNGMISIENSIGRFASPNRRNGNGLGIMYSMVERKKQSAPNQAVILSVLTGFTEKKKGPTFQPVLASFCINDHSHSRNHSRRTRSHHHRSRHDRNHIHYEVLLSFLSPLIHER